MDTEARRRRLSDLNSLGRPVVFDDGAFQLVPQLDDDGNEVLGDNGFPVLVREDEPPVTVWVAKLNSYLLSDALKKAAQRQAVTLSGSQDHDSETWQAMFAEASDLGRDVAIEMLVDIEMLGRRDAVEARIAATTEVDEEKGEEVPGKWAKDGYLEGLHDAWVGGLKAEHAVDPNHPEAARVFGEIAKFNAEVDQAFTEEYELEKELLQAASDERIIEKLTDYLVRSESQDAWSVEYRRRVVLAATRTCSGPVDDPRRPDECRCVGKARHHRNRYFESYEEVVDTDDEIVEALYDTWNQVMVDVRSGKGLRATLSSSPPSESPAREETSTSSGLEAASD